jgi:hypothetical protein
MSTSKKPCTPVTRRLRRYLGALLALGFGAAWWSFVPPSTAAASVPVVTHGKVTHAKVAELPSAPLRRTKRLAALPRPIRPRVHRVVPHVTPPVIVPQPVIEPLPEIEPLPVTEPLPVVEPLPVEPPVVEPPIVDDPPQKWPPIRTRSS